MTLLRNTSLRPHLWGPHAFWRTLRFRFALWVGALLLLAQIAVGAYIYVQLEHRLLQNVDDTLQLNAVQIRALIVAQSGDLTAPQPDAYASLAADLHEQRLTARILSPTGEIVQAFGVFRDLPVEQSIIDAAQRREAHLTTVPDPAEPDENLRVFATPIVQADALVGIVEVTQTLDSVDDTLEQLLLLARYVMPVSVLIAAVGGYVLAARALARVDRITTLARHLSAEDLSARLNLPHTNDEIGRLATTFDMMLARLDTAFRRERQFTADASHELRTPLTAMRTILDLTREKPRSAAEYAAALDDLAEETARLQTLVADLLRLARGEDQTDTARELVDLSALLDDICASLRPLAETRSLDLTCTVPDGLALHGDRDSLIRLFVNLLDNAIKFTGAGTIRVAGEAGPDGALTVTVTDTGPGISAAHLPHIFERFYRVDPSRSSAGTGLGLTLALTIARAHGGTIDVRSTEGEGTQFTVTLRG